MAKKSSKANNAGERERNNAPLENLQQKTFQLLLPLRFSDETPIGLSRKRYRAEIIAPHCPL
ncbi:MAG: hypothetical protein ACLP2Y_15725 [Limisphaerales bacterium]